MALDLSGGVGPVRPGTRILVWCASARDEPRVAGLPLWQRAVYTACRAGFERLLIVTGGSPEELRARLERDGHLHGRRWEVVSEAEDWRARIDAEGGRWVALGEDWVVEDEFLAALCDSAVVPASASPDGPLAADAANLVEWAREGWAPCGRVNGAALTLVPRPMVYVRVTDTRSAREAESALFRSLARNVTNFFARTVDRPMSRAISRVLARTRVTPNQITIFSTLLGIVGSLVLLDPAYTAGVLGSFLFFAHTVIDGCDGEIARLKFQESKTGAKLDLIGDNVVHAFLFPCLALRFYFARPDGPFLALGVLTFGGIIASWVAVYALILKAEPSPRVLAFFELVANREFAYLLLALAIIGKLEWFVWAMTVGIWVFPLGLVGIWVFDRRRKA